MGSDGRQPVACGHFGPSSSVFHPRPGPQKPSRQPGAGVSRVKGRVDVADGSMERSAGLYVGIVSMLFLVDKILDVCSYHDRIWCSFLSRVRIQLQPLIE